MYRKTKHKNMVNRPSKSKDTDNTTDNKKERAPFQIPPENEIFRLRVEERRRKKEYHDQQRALPVHEKTTQAFRMRAKTAKVRRRVGIKQFEDTDSDDSPTDPAFVTQDQDEVLKLASPARRVEKTDISDFIAKKREMFLVQYSLQVKREEMKRMEEISQAEVKKLETAEQYLEEDAMIFDKFLKENDKNSVDAIKMAEAETKAKMEKVVEIKKIRGEIASLKSQISKNEDQIKECQTYKIFLDAMTPTEYKASRDKRREIRKAERKKRKEEDRQPAVQVQSSPTPSSSKRTPISRSTSRTSRASIRTKRIRKPSVLYTTDSTMSVVAPDAAPTSDSDDSCDLYFTDPQQLLDIFADLEEQNLSLITHIQETEEALDEMKQNMEKTKAKMNNEIEVLKAQIIPIDEQIRIEENKAAELEHKSRMFSYGHYEGDDQDKMLSSLNSKVEEVFRSCIGDNEANISTLQMLTNIENTLEELLEKVDMMPQEQADKVMKKVKILEMKRELNEDEKNQRKIESVARRDEQCKRRLERAKASTTNIPTGRKLVFRSRPPEKEKVKTDVVDKGNDLEKELAYYFT